MASNGNHRITYEFIVNLGGTNAPGIHKVVFVNLPRGMSPNDETRLRWATMVVEAKHGFARGAFKIDSVTEVADEMKGANIDVMA